MPKWTNEFDVLYFEDYYYLSKIHKILEGII